MAGRMSAFRQLCSLMGQGREALRGVDAFGCLRSLRARSALDGANWVQRGLVEIAVGHRLTACYKIRAVVCSLPRASLLFGSWILHPPIAAFGDAAGVVEFARLMPRWDQAQIGADVSGSADARGIVDCGHKGERGQLSNARDGHEPT